MRPPRGGRRVNQEVWMWMSPWQVAVLVCCLVCGFLKRFTSTDLIISVSGLVSTQGDVVYCEFFFSAPLNHDNPGQDLFGKIKGALERRVLNPILNKLEERQVHNLCFY